MQEQVKFKILPRLLDHIGLAMYSSVSKAISELVANCYDAGANEVYVRFCKKDGQIVSISIDDDGEGMTCDEVKNIYLSLGYNRRFADIKENKEGQLKRRPIGNKGIGKLAALGIARDLMIKTIKRGQATTLEISRHCFEKDDLELDRVYFPLSTSDESDKNKHATFVYLSNLLEHAAIVDIPDLREFLAREFGLATDFSIYVDNQKIASIDISGEHRQIKETIEDLGDVSGNITIASRVGDVNEPGIITYIRGRAIEGPTLYEINSPSHIFRVANRIVGELTADFLDPDMPKNIIDGYIISTSRDAFNKSHPYYQKYKRWVESILIKISREIETKQERERLERIRRDPNIQSILRQIPPELRHKFEEAIKAIIPRLNNLSDKNADVIIQFIARLAETQSMLQILKRINEATAEDLDGLSTLFQEWGVFEISSISTLIKNRLQVITKLEEMINNVGTKEFPDMHRILENNLWLLNDNYKLYASNRQLKTILGEKFAKKFKKDQLKRPDLICRNLLNLYLVIELKRPAYKISVHDYPQVMEYNSILSSCFPSAERLECYLIGREYDHTMNKEPTRQGKVTIYLKSYNEIIEEAKQRFAEVLKIITEE